MIDWKPWTDPVRDSRYALYEPWLLDDGRAVATDGKALIVSEIVDGVEPPGDRRIPKIANYLAQIRRLPEGHWISAHGIEGPPEDADPWWNTGKLCLVCCGTMVCSTCGSPCGHCNRSGRVGGGRWLDHRCHISIDGLSVDRRYAWIISQLPGHRMKAIDWEVGRAIQFDSDVGCGLVMPLA